MKIMSLRNGGDLVNNSSCGLVVYRVTTIPSWHNFHITETQFTILYINNLNMYETWRRMYEI